MEARTGQEIGVDVAGFLRGGLGLGEAARLYVGALQAAGVPTRTTTVDVPMPERGGRGRSRPSPKLTEFADLETDEPTPFNLICVNADELPRFRADVGEGFFAGRRSIGVWAWETDLLPGAWTGAFQLVDEIWTYSHYVAEIIGRSAMVPVLRMPLPVLAPPVTSASIDIVDPDRFTFLFLFDFFSTVQRKNPLGLIEAFRRAFEPGEGPQLVLKSINGDYKPERMKAVEEAAGGRDDIRILDRFLPAAEKNALIHQSDCYVSLHRAEGFGLGMAEAMALGKPVIATGYSGNTDFMTHSNSYLVRHKMTTVGDGGDNYPSQGVWAEPDLDHAAQLMRHVWTDRDEARERGRRAKVDIERDFSPERIGQQMAARLGRLAGAPESAFKAPHQRAPVDIEHDAPSHAMHMVDLKLDFDPETHAREQGGPANIARVGVLKAMRPYTYHQEELNTKLAAAVRDTAEQLQRLLKETALDQSRGRDLRRVIEGMRARPATTHPFIAHTDDYGRWVLGFDATREDASAQLEGYRTFEDVFRGSEQLIRDRQRPYVELFDSGAQVLDLGCGRGEFLDLLDEAGIAGTGIDLDDRMVSRCREKGHDVQQAEGAAFLEGLEERSLGGIFAAQVVEHLSADQLDNLLALAASRLRAGGVVVLETVNPHCPTALKAFWTDPTHHHPLFPEVLLALGRIAGFVRGDVIFPGGDGDPDNDVYVSPDYAVVLHTA